MFGRFAPTPTSQLHIGNLRTALVAYLAARSSSRGFLIRVEDLDGPRTKNADAITASQLEDLAYLGMVHDGPILRQQERTSLYEEALLSLSDLVYECFCSRKDIAEATRAPHSPGVDYPGTCRRLSESDKETLRAQRSPALRINASSTPMTIIDELHGRYTRHVDDFVIRRSDGVFSYNFAVVVDDGLQDIDQVVRAEDLLDSAPRQAWLATRLGFSVPQYLHVPLVYSANGQRMAKRDQAVSLRRLREAGVDTGKVLGHLAHSLGLTRSDENPTMEELVDRFDPARIPLTPWLVDPFDWD